MSAGPISPNVMQQYICTTLRKYRAQPNYIYERGVVFVLAGANSPNGSLSPRTRTKNYLSALQSKYKIHAMQCIEM